MNLKIQFLILFLFAFLFGFLFSKNAFAANYTLSGSVKDNTGAIFNGATVDVYTPGTTTDVVFPTTSDSSGNYSFSSVPAGTYDIKVTPRSGSMLGPAIAPKYTISTNANVNFILTPAGTLTLTGHLYGSTGLPLANQTVDIHLSSTNAEVTNTTTDSNGYYSISLSPNIYDIRVIGNNNSASLAIPNNSYYIVIGSYSLSQSTVLELTLPAKKVTVHVQDPSGSSVSNIAVSAGNSALSVSIAGESYFGSDEASGTTDASGNAILYLFSDTYTFNANPPSGSNFLSTSLSNVSVNSDMTVTMTLEQPIILSGHMYGSTGLPLPNQTVDIHLSSTNAEVKSTTTDSTGFYSVSLSPDTYDIRLIGNNNSSSLGIPNNSYYIVIGSYSLTQNNVLDLTLPAKKVTVHVQDSLGNPVRSAGVSTSNSALSVPIVGGSYFGSDAASANTDASGNAVLYIFAATYTFNATPPSGTTFLSTSLSNVSINSDTTQTITMPQQTVVLSGHLYGSTGLPLPNQTVDIHLSSTNAEVTDTTTNSNGFYSISLSPNTYDIRLIGNNTSTSLAIPNDSYYIVIGSYALNQTKNLDLTLPAKKVAIHIQDAFGNSLNNIKVATQNPVLTVPIAGGGYFGSDAASGTTDALGNTVIYIFPGTYTFNATPPSGSIYASFSLNDINVNSDQTELVSLQYVHPAPLTTATLSSRYSGETYTDPTTVTLSATATAGFSVAHTYYTLDGGVQQTYTSPFTVSGSGTHTLTYWSVDNAGIPENPNTKTFFVDDPPKINAVSGATINEGGTYNVAGSFTDSDSTSWTGTVDYGDGSGVQPLTIHPDKKFTLSHQYLDNKPNNTPYTVSVTITDNQGAGSTVTTSVVILNVAPTVSPVTVLTNPVVLGNPVSVDSVSFTDPGVLDTHIAIWNWGDGTSSQATLVETNGSGYVSATDHVYATAGIYQISLVVTDKDGASGTGTSQSVAVYQPTHSGLFSGHSGFTSPAGADITNPQATGRVQFKLDVKYANGGATPTGNVTFNFPSGNLTLSATSFNYFVVSGNQAFVMGSGSVNNVSGYTFFATGIDGTQTGTGYIRFQITDPNGHIVYDTQPGAAQTTVPTVPVTGMVVVHN